MPDTTPNPAEAKSATETPDWTKDTPADCSYQLAMYDDGGTSLENIDMNRDEYILLKRYLARLRDLPFDLKDHDEGLANDDLVRSHAEYLLPEAPEQATA